MFRGANLTHYIAIYKVILVLFFPVATFPTHMLCDARFTLSPSHVLQLVNCASVKARLDLTCSLTIKQFGQDDSPWAWQPQVREG
jgi:hypothetical protein